MTERKTSLDGLAIGLLVACCLFWGFQQVLVKATLAEVPPVYQASIRFAAASVLIWLWCRQRGVVLFGRDGTLGAGLLAGLLFAGEFACLYAGLHLTTASRATVFLYTSPFWVAVLLPLFVKSERLYWLQWLGLAMAFVGVALALRDGLVAPSQPQQWQGDVLALGGGLLWGLTTVVIRSTGLARLSAEKLLFYQVAVSAVTLPFLSLALGEVWVTTFSSFAIASLIVQTVVGAFASYLTWMWLLGRYPATKMSAFVFLTPVFALMFGGLWLGDPITLGLIAALVLVTAGIVLVGRKAPA
jgi:drug/metabolite transporter (DMT)-like permease